MKKMIIRFLAFLSRRIIKKYQPLIIGITGSVGKTSAKEAVYAVLSQKFSARTNIKNYNNEFGLPFTVIGRESPRRNPLKWLWLFLRAWALLLFKQKYPEVLVLEMGIDRPGDMEKLVAIAPPDIAVLTNIGVSHLEFFGSQENILKEKSKIFSRMSGKNFAVLNFDDQRARSITSSLKANVISYGLVEDADVRILNYEVIHSEPNNSYGTEVELEYKDNKAKVFFVRSIGLPIASAAAAGIAVGIAAGLSFQEAAEGLAKIKVQPGRMQILPGANGSLLLDDTYNAAPNSTKSALQEMLNLRSAVSNENKIDKLIVVLGDMLELGELADQAHQEIGEYVRANNVDIFIGVGEKMRLANPDLWFANSDDAIVDVLKLAKPGALFLVKGSQGARMEKISFALLGVEDQARAVDLLPRQGKEWKKR